MSSERREPLPNGACYPMQLKNVRPYLEQETGIPRAGARGTLRNRARALLGVRKEKEFISFPNADDSSCQRDIPDCYEKKYELDREVNKT